MQEVDERRMRALNLESGKAKLGKKEFMEKERVAREREQEDQL